MTDTFILQELITDDLPFRVHNVKIDTLICQKDLPMMFLAHYDRLDDNLKAQKPLGEFFYHMNDLVTASQACQILGLPQGVFTPATHIKISGSVVIVLDDFPLALHLRFTNTAKDHQAIFSQDDPSALILQEAGRFLLSGNVNVLHKNPTKTLVSIDLSDDEFIINPSDTYTRLPNSHALATTQILNTLNAKSPQALTYLKTAITEKSLEHTQNMN
ncbi:MAG: hypothetical protein Q3971_00695 [Moraxella sp.]|nr:hypothetical protein [Moraxella sp.]